MWPFLIVAGLGGLWYWSQHVFSSTGGPRGPDQLVPTPTPDVVPGELVHVPGQLVHLAVYGSTVGLLGPIVNTNAPRSVVAQIQDVSVIGSNVVVLDSNSIDFPKGASLFVTYDSMRP